MIRKLQELKHLPERAAPAVAQALEDEIVSAVERQQGPTGEAWKSGREGKPMLQNVRKHLEVRAVDGAVLATLTGHYVRHSRGAVRGKVKRQILPTRGLPDAVSKAIARVIAGEFKQTMGAK